jgi:hypothetical protein
VQAGSGGSSKAAYQAESKVIEAQWSHTLTSGIEWYLRYQQISTSREDGTMKVGKLSIVLQLLESKAHIFGRQRFESSTLSQPMDPFPSSRQHS